MSALTLTASFEKVHSVADSATLWKELSFFRSMVILEYLFTNQ